MNKTTFVSGCDANYFPILIEWIHSVRAFKESKDMDICIMDGGLSEEQIEKLKPYAAQIVKPDWPANIPAYKIRGRDYLKCCVCRPFIPKIFPGYDQYIWMDADTWLQSWEAIPLYQEGARRKKLAITAQVDRAYPRQIRLKWLGRLPWKVRGFYYTNALKAFGFKTAQKLLPYNVLNAGAFAMDADAPHWLRWQELVVEALQKGKVFTAEQLTLGMITYLEDYPVEILPAWTQWLCENKPIWDEDKNVFVEPYLPHKTLSIVHMSGWDDMRLDRSLTTKFKTLAGNSIEKSYRYQGFDGETP